MNNNVLCRWHHPRSRSWELVQSSMTGIVSSVERIRNWKMHNNELKTTLSTVTHLVTVTGMGIGPNPNPNPYLGILISMENSQFHRIVWGTVTFFFYIILSPRIVVWNTRHRQNKDEWNMLHLDIIIHGHPCCRDQGHGGRSPIPSSCILYFVKDSHIGEFGECNKYLSLL